MNATTTFQAWSADSFVLDILVEKDSIQEPAACFLTLLLDCDSLIPMGWNIHTEPPSVESFMSALRHGIARIGAPQSVVLDNDRAYKMHGPSNEKSIQQKAAVHRVEIRFHSPLNSRSKLCDRAQRKINQQFSRFWKCFKGSDTKALLLDDVRSEFELFARTMLPVEAGVAHA